MALPAGYLDKSLVEDVRDGKSLLIGDLSKVGPPDDDDDDDDDDNGDGGDDDEDNPPCVERFGDPQLGERLHQARLEAGCEAGKKKGARDAMIGIIFQHEPWESEMSEPMSGSVDQIFGSEDLFSASKGSHLRKYHH